jgi:hypothetical protein
MKYRAGHGGPRGRHTMSAVSQSLHSCGITARDSPIR